MVRVLGSDGACAYAWPSGDLFVTRGLLRLLDDAELAAALAHELGHLGPAAAVGDGPGRAVHAVALTDADTCHAESAEFRADDVGVDLLRARGIPAGALRRALAKVRDDPNTAADCRAALARRVARLPDG